jgi:hypothetical protein
MEMGAAVVLGCGVGRAGSTSVGTPTGDGVIVGVGLAGGVSVAGPVGVPVGLGVGETMTMLSGVSLGRGLAVGARVDVSTAAVGRGVGVGGSTTAHPAHIAPSTIASQTQRAVTRASPLAPAARRRSAAPPPESRIRDPQSAIQNPRSPIIRPPLQSSFSIRVATTRPSG